MELWQVAFQDIWGLVTRLYTRAYDRQSIGRLLTEAFKNNDLHYGEREALLWAGEFEMCQDTISRHVNMFEGVGYDLAKLIRVLKEDIKGSRLSKASIRANVSRDNPEYDKLLALVDGMSLCPSPSFRPNGPHDLPKLSNTYKRLSRVVNKMITEDFIDKKLAFVLPKAMVLEHCPSFHLSRLSWTVKFGKQCGRPLVDASAGDMPINSKFTKEAYDKIWGVIQHPTLSDLVLMVSSYASEVMESDSMVSWQDFVIWKVDLKGAYTLLSFADEAIPYIAAQLDGGNIIFFICGVFGYTGTPMAFQVASRGIKFEVNRLIKGRVEIYVDDLFGVSLKTDVDEDVRATSDFCRRLFNAECIADSKTEIGRKVDVIGYSIDLDMGRISIAKKNYLKVIYGLSSIKLDEKVPTKFLQRFASWLSRYSVICPVLRPLSKAIYGSFSMDKRYEHVSVDLSRSAKMALRLFRAIFLVAMLDEGKFTRSFYSFQRVLEPDYIIEFDASLFGCGILLYKCENGRELYLGATSFSIEQLRFGMDSTFQNAAEFTAGVLGLVVLSKICEKGSSVVFRGDSCSALTWLEEGRFRSNFITRMAFVYIYMGLTCELLIGESIHISSEDNHKADYLSRNYNQVTDISERVGALIKLLDPHSPFVNDSDYVTFWTSLPGIINEFVSSVSINQ